MKINNIFKHPAIYPLSLSGWLILFLNFLYLIHSPYVDTGIGTFIVIPAVFSICYILIGLSIITEIICSIINYEINSKFIDNKFIKIFGIIGILVTLIVIPIRFINFIYVILTININYSF